MDLTQYHLFGSGYSGRAVRVRRLDGQQAAAAERSAAATIGKDSSMIEFRQAVAIEFIERMVVQVTEPVSEAELLKATWTKVSEESLSDTLYTLFTAKDISLLTALQQRLYEVSAAEVDKIEGKALTVSAD